MVNGANPFPPAQLGGYCGNYIIRFSLYRIVKYYLVIELIIIPRHVYEHLDKFLLSEEEAQKVWEITQKKI